MAANRVSSSWVTPALPASAGASYNSAKPRWSAADDAVISQFYSNETAQQIGARIGRSAESVRQRMKRLGVTKAFRPWTAKEDLLLVDQYETRTAAEIGKTLKRSRVAVKNRIKFLGLLKPVAAQQERESTGTRRIITRPAAGNGWGPITIHRLGV